MWQAVIQFYHSFFFKEMKEEYDEFDDDGMEMKDEEMSEDEGILF